MKKVLVFTFLIMIGMGVFFNSCSKSNNVSLEDGNKIVQTSKDLIVQNHLIQFRDKVEIIRKNPTKDGEMVDAEQAILDLEALFNITYGFSNEKYSKTKVDTTYLQIPVNDGMVSMNDIAATYDEILTEVIGFYDACTFSDKKFYLLNIEKVNLGTSSIDLSVRSVVGQKSEGNVVFGPDDDWHYGNLDGDCDFDDPGTDAAEELQIALLNNRPLYNPPAGYHFVYINEEDISLFGHEYSQKNNPQSYIFYIERPDGTFTDEEQCLTPAEMNLQYDLETELIYDFLPDEYDKPANWTFMDCDLTGLEETNPNVGDVPSIHHQNELTYAYRYVVEDEIIDNPKDLH